MSLNLRVLLSLITLAIATQACVPEVSELNEFESVLQGPSLSGNYAGVQCFEDGLCFAGFRTDAIQSGARIRRSTDAGQTWSDAIEIDGAESARAYYFAANENVILSGGGAAGAGTGGVPNIFRSEDRGLTWTTVMSSAAIKNIKQASNATAVYDIVYVGDHTFITGLEGAPVLLKSTDDGKTWVYDQYLEGSTIRRLRDMGDGVLLALALDSGIWKSTDLGKTWQKKPSSPAAVFSVATVAPGIYVAGTAGVGGRSVRIVTRSRTNGIVRVTTLKPHGLTIGQRIGIYQMSDRSFDARPFATVESVPDLFTFTYKSAKSDGNHAGSKNDVAEVAENGSVFKTAGDQQLYRSTDSGETWTAVATVTAYSDITYVRTLVHLGDGRCWAFVAASEYSQTDRGLQSYVSDDFGVSWSWAPNPYVSPYGELNAIYDATEAGPEAFIFGAGPDASILRIRR